DSGDKCFIAKANPPPLPGLTDAANTSGGTGGTGPSVPGAGGTGGIPPSGTAGTDKLNTSASINYLKSNVTSQNVYNGGCLASVQRALSEGGVTLSCPTGAGGKGGWAGNCNGPLQSLGFSSLGASDSSPQAGDILVIQHPHPSNGALPIGHIAMYNGSQWVSDTNQNTNEVPPGNPYGSGGTDPQYWRP
ncbi:hypothetical protein H0X32_02120, partial [Patescibacteria group bacterium]|nr:hypothetical protein [Patescibacteria group bacterium]